MNPKQSKKNLNSQDIFKSAEVFRHTADLLHRELSRGQMHLAIAWLVNASLSLELYLKCLLNMEHGCFPETHDPKELFRNLKRQTRDTLRKQHDELVSKDPAFKGLVAKHPELNVDLNSLLEEAKDAFTIFRYAFEGIPEKTGFGLSIFAWCVRDRIIRRRPGWGAFGV